MRRPIELGLGCGLALAACQAQPEFPDPTPEPAEPTLFGEFVAMGVGDGLAICGASFDYVERFAELYLEGSSSELEDPISYYYVDADTIARPDICGAKALACSRLGVVYASSPINTHEVVHAMRQGQHDLVSPGRRVLEEGFAQWHYPIDLGWDESFLPSKMPAYFHGAVPRNVYDPAAQVMSVIADSESAAVAEAFVDASADIETGADLDALLRSTIDVELAELDAIYSAQPRCSAAARARLLVDCATDPQEWSPSLGNGGPRVIVGIGEFVCDDPRLIGPLEGRLYASYAIDAPSDGTYTLLVDVDTPQRLELVSCDAPCGDDIDLRWDERHREEELVLASGRYVVRLSREVGDDAPVGFRLYAPAP